MTNEEIYTIDNTPFRVKIDEPEIGPSGDRLRKWNALKLNIDIHMTMFHEEGYDSVQDKNMYTESGIYVYAVCIQCGKGRWTTYHDYNHLCKSCIMRLSGEQS